MFDLWLFHPWTDILASLDLSTTKWGLNWNEGLSFNWRLIDIWLKLVQFFDQNIRTSSIWYHYVVTKCLQAGSFDFVSTQRKSFLFRDSFKIIPNKNSRKDFRSDTDQTTQSIQFSQKRTNENRSKRYQKLNLEILIRIL